MVDALRQEEMLLVTQVPLVAAEAVDHSVLNRLRGVPEKRGHVLRVLGRQAALTTAAVAAIALSGCGNVEQPLPVNPQTQESILRIEQETKDNYLAIMDNLEADAELNGSYFVNVGGTGEDRAYLFPQKITYLVLPGNRENYYSILTREGVRNIIVSGKSVKSLEEGMIKDIKLQNTNGLDLISPDRSLFLENNGLMLKRPEGEIKIGDLTEALLYNRTFGRGFQGVGEATNVEGSDVNKLMGSTIKYSRSKVIDNEENLVESKQARLETSKELSGIVDSLINPSPTVQPSK